MRPVVSGSSIVTVDFDRMTSKIYWADATEKKIWSAYQNGTERQEVSELIHIMLNSKSRCANHRWSVHLNRVWIYCSLFCLLGVLQWFDGTREYCCGLGGSESVLD